MPFLGDSAIRHMGAVLEEMEATLYPLLAGKRTQMPVIPDGARSSTLNVNAIHGGAPDMGPDFTGLPAPCVADSCRITIDRRFLIEEERAGHLNAELRLLIEVVARACKTISVAVGKGALGGVLGDAGTGNVQGEAQKKLDVIANDVLLEANAWGGHLAGLASEEMEHSVPIPDVYPRGNYLLLFDPLDGSSNIDVNVSVGTIFSVLRCPEGVTTPEDHHFLQPGERQVCAGYGV